MEVGIYRDEEFQYKTTTTTTDRQGTRKVDDCKDPRIPYYDEEVDRRRWDSPRRGQSEIIKRTVLARDTVASTPIIGTGPGDLRVNTVKFYKNAISTSVEDSSMRTCECSLDSRRCSMESCDLSIDPAEYLNDELTDYVEVIDACTNTNLGGKRYRGAPKPFNPYISEYMANFNRCPRFDELGQQCNCYIEPSPSMTQNVTLTVQRPLVTPYKTMLNSPPMVPVIPECQTFQAPNPVFFLDSEVYTGPVDRTQVNHVQCTCTCTCTQEQQYPRPPEHLYHQEQSDNQESERTTTSALSGGKDNTSSSSVSNVEATDTSKQLDSTTTMKISLSSLRKRSYSQTKLDCPLKIVEAVIEEQKSKQFQNRHLETVNHESTSNNQASTSTSLSSSNGTDNQLSEYQPDRTQSSELLLSTTNLNSGDSGNSGNSGKSGESTMLTNPQANMYVVNYVTVKPYQSVPMIADRMQKIKKQIVVNSNKMTLRSKKRKRVYKPLLLRPSKDPQKPGRIVSQRIKNPKVAHIVKGPNTCNDRNRERERHRDREKPLQQRTACPRCLGNRVNSVKEEKSKTRSLFSFLKFPWRKT